jgi:hypothetical protein
MRWWNVLRRAGETQLLEPLDSQQQAEQQQQTQKPRHEQEQGKEEGQQVAEQAQQHDGGGDAGEGAPLLQQDERGRFRPHPDQIRCVHSHRPRCGNGLIFFQVSTQSICCADARFQSAFNLRFLQDIAQFSCQQTR